MKISEAEPESKDEGNESSAAHDSEMSKILEQKMNVTIPESKEDEKLQKKQYDLEKQKEQQMRDNAKAFL